MPLSNKEVQKQKHDQVIDNSLPLCHSRMFDRQLIIYSLWSQKVKREWSPAYESDNGSASSLIAVHTKTDISILGDFQNSFKLVALCF